MGSDLRYEPRRATRRCSSPDLYVAPPDNQGGRVQVLIGRPPWLSRGTIRSSDPVRIASAAWGVTFGTLGWR